MLISCVVWPCVFDIMQVASSEVEEEKDDGGDMEISDQGHLKNEVCSLIVWLRYRGSLAGCFICKRDCL